jgi:predicted small metal-binding protein
MDVCIEQEPAEVDLKTLTERNRSRVTLSICKDLGYNCSFEATGTTNNEVMRKFIDHVESAHNMDVLTADVIYRVQKSIKNYSLVNFYGS